MSKKTTTTHTLCAHRSTKITCCKPSFASPPRKCKIEAHRIWEHSLCERCRGSSSGADFSTTITTASSAPSSLEKQQSDIKSLPPSHATARDQVTFVNNAKTDMMGSMQPSDRKEKYNVFSRFRSKGWKVKSTPNARRSSDEGLGQMSGWSKATGTSTRLTARSDDAPLSVESGSPTTNESVTIRYPENRIQRELGRSDEVRTEEAESQDTMQSTKSEEILEGIQQIQVGTGEDLVKRSDYNDSWEIYLVSGNRASVGSAIDIKLNPERLGSLDLAYEYQEVIGQHPYEIELSFNAAALKKKNEIAKEEQQAAIATARDEAILEKKRRQWQDRKEADEHEVTEATVAQTNMNEKLARAAAQKAERDKEHARLREERRKKRETDVSASTTWTGLMKGVSELPQQSQQMRIADEKVHAQKINSEASASLTIRKPGHIFPQRNRISEEVSSIKTISQSPETSQTYPGLGTTVPPSPRTPEEFEVERIREAKAGIKQNYPAALRLAQESDLQNRQAANLFPRPRMSQEESSSKTRLYGEKLKSKAKIWTGNLIGPEKPKVLPLTYMRGGTWVSEDGIPIIGEPLRATHMIGGVDALYQSSNLQQKDLWSLVDGPQSSMEPSPSTFPLSKSSMEDQPLFARKPQPSDGPGRDFRSQGSDGGPAKFRSPITVSTSTDKLELQHVVSEYYTGISHSQKLVSTDVTPSSTDRNHSRRQPTPSLAAADLRVGRSVDGRHAWRNPRKDMTAPAEL